MFFNIGLLPLFVVIAAFSPSQGVSTSPRAARQTTLKSATWNLRYDSQPDNITVAQTIATLPDPLQPPAVYFENTNERPWSIRRIHVSNELQEQEVDVVGFQEALVRQVNDIQELLGSGYGWVGVGRDDGVQAGEYSPVFYKKSALRLLKWDTFWLSDTPFTPSKYPGAGSYRICTALQLQSVLTGATYTHLNTHLDDQSDAQRRLGASLILHRANYEALNTSRPVIVTGDFNSPQSGSDSGAYQIITGQTPPVNISADFLAKFPVPSGSKTFDMLDLKAETPRQNVSGHYATYTGFAAPSNSGSYTRIDFILGGSNGGWTSKSYQVGNTLFDDGIWASDHRPVFTEIVLD